MLKNFLFSSLWLLLTLDLSAASFPDLLELPSISEAVSKRAAEANVASEVLEQQALNALKLQLEEIQDLNSVQKGRLISLIEELQRKPDQAYLTLKKISGEEGKLWYQFREIYLADYLGLEEDTQKLAHIINDRLLLKRLKINKIEFCKSVKGFGLFEAMPSIISQNKTVIIYVEINYLEHKLEAGQYSSSCRASFRVTNKNGDEVFNFSYPEPFNYSSQSLLNDYFIWMKWTPSLPQGEYVMHLKIEDERAKTRENKDFKFEIK